MAITNKERIGRALDLLREGLYPFVEREMLSIHNKYWEKQASSHLCEDRNLKRSIAQRLQEDVADLINVIFGEWRTVFGQTLGNAEKNIVGELKVLRNDWAHGRNFSTDDTLFTARDTVVIKAFSQMYRDQKSEFPAECREKDDEKRLTDAYPIHPELFERLYSDWSSLDKFQRTRGVLRLMAKVISYLWQENDKNLMILPANVPMADPQVQSELTRYLDDNWLPVIDKDVDGTNSLPVYLDSQHSNLGRYSACRRVTRTIYMGSAPLQKAANKGLDIRRIKLGSTQPGENVATFGDALRRLTRQATYLYVDNSDRYWIDTQPNVTRTAQDRATQYREDQTWDEIIKRLKQEKETGDSAGVHIAPSSSSDVPDEEAMGVRLVLLHPNFTHSNKDKNSTALIEAKQILNTKGSAPRSCKNLLIFLALDQTKKENLSQWVNQYLAWESIVEDKEILNLNPFQNKQAAAQLKEADNTVKIELVPEISQKQKRRFYGSVELNSLRLIADVQQIADEVVQHLISLKGAKVKVIFDIEAEEEDGIPDDVIRTVSENCKTLKFKSQGFEER
jgi:Swt1-like HEPN